MLTALALLAAMPLAAPPPALVIADPQRARHYAVIFEVTTDATGAVTAVTVSKVIDVNSGSTAAVDLPVPEAYVAAARAIIEERARANPTPSKTYFTYFYFDPRTPRLVLTSPI